MGLLKQDHLDPAKGPAGLAEERARPLRKMDDPSNLSDLAELGRIAAAKQVKPEHLPAAFDLRKAQE